MRRVRISIEISVRMKIIIVLALIAVELIFKVLPRGEASAWLLILVFIWMMTERQKERREARQSKVAPVEAEAEREEVESEDDGVDAINDPADDSRIDRGDQQDPGGLPESRPVDPGSEGDGEMAAAVMAATGSEDGNIWAQALKVVEASEKEHGALGRKRVDPVGVIRQVLVQQFGEAWQDAYIAHFHALSGNCIFVALAPLHRDEEGATLACRVIEVDPAGNLVLPSPVRSKEEEQ